MKKSILLIAAAFGMMTAQAQEAPKAIAAPQFTDNWQVGVEGGVLAPLAGYDFIEGIRGGFGLHVDKMITPSFGLGVEGLLGVNTSDWNPSINGHSSDAFDNMYLGVYGKLNLMNLIWGYKCEGRKFDVDVIAGAGWGRYFYTRWYDQNEGKYGRNHFATKVGLSLNYNMNKSWTFSLKPSIMYNMTDLNVNGTTAAYNVHNATFSLFAGVAYNINPGFECVRPYDQAEVDALNAQINDLRGQLEGCQAANNECNTKVNALAAKLAECEARKAPVQEVVTSKINREPAIFFSVGSSKISASQQPNVEMVAKYLKNHPEAKVVIKGYASKDGNIDYNTKLAAARAESVKNSLVNKYGIAADRVTAQGEGIGEMFDENDWNRVALCIIEK